MKNIKDIMDEMGSLCEKDINKIHSVIDYCANGEIPDCCPEGTEAPLCNEVPFCCAIIVPEGFVVVTNPVDIRVGIANKCCTVVPGIECCETVCGCRILFQKFSVNACIDVRASLKVRDESNNCTFLCCSDCVCFDSQGISCAPAPEFCTDLNFTILDTFLVDVGPVCENNTSKRIIEIRGNIGFNTGNGCEPTPPPTVC